MPIIWPGKQRMEAIMCNKANPMKNQAGEGPVNP